MSNKTISVKDHLTFLNHVTFCSTILNHLELFLHEAGDVQYYTHQIIIHYTK